jgi:hypothetical protein
MNIDKPNMFREMIRTGINLFTGAGFSKLPDINGKSLPDASELCQEICDIFSIPSQYATDLEKVSNIVNLRAKQQFQDYLRGKYTVTDYNPLYDTLNLISIHSYITTNIDNIIQCVMDNSNRYSLHDVVFYGASKSSTTTIQYIPLHGNVKDITSHLYFGKNELANVDSDNKELFALMQAKLMEAPTLFWGYGFHDNAVERTITKVLDSHCQDVWIQCMPGSENVDYFRELGCNVIEGTTEDLLLWIQENCCTFDNAQDEVNYSKQLKKYFIPSRNQIETVTAEDFFLNGSTHWYCVLSNYPYITKAVNLLYEKSFRNKNLIAIGIPFSGKTTLLMQLAIKVTAMIKLNVFDITTEEAKRIVNVLNGQKAFVFIDDCCEDVESLKIFMQEPNINVIAFADDYTFESSKHLLDGFKYEKVGIGELEIDEAQQIFEKIPPALRADQFLYKNDSNEKFSMIEMIGRNVKGYLSKDRIRNVLRRVKQASQKGFQIIALTTYLVHNKSALSTDVLCAYFDTTDYQYIQNLILTAQRYLSEVDVQVLPDTIDQDYYCVRSHLFAYYTFQVLCSDYKADFADVIRKFVLNVPPYRIYKHYIFKRSAYDAKFFNSIFAHNAHDLYEYIFRFDGSAYTLQQWALYKAYCNDYSGAFADIDKAINMNPYNFSIKNSHAIILFEANKEKKTSLAKEGMDQAMSILQQCFKSDKRRIYHAQKYSEFALFLSRNWNDKSYLVQAREWLEEIILSGETTSRYSKKLLNDINSAMELQ